jgi:diaminopimelate epimerase
MLEPPRDPESRVFYRIFNSDGSEVEQCGNGARCVAALMYERHPERGRELLMGSPGGPVRARIQSDGTVSLDMGIPNFAPSSLPLDAPAEAPPMPSTSTARGWNSARYPWAIRMRYCESAT